jgi:hypothetical protein
VSVQYDPAWRGRERGQADCRWYPDEDLGLDIFLHRNVSGAVDGGVAVVPWKPSEKAFPDSAERVLHTVRAVLEEITSDSATLRYWSFRWARNALRTFAETASYVSASRCGRPIVIAAAGPSLEISLRFCRAIGTNFIYGPFLPLSAHASPTDVPRISSSPRTPGYGAIVISMPSCGNGRVRGFP